MNMLQKYHKIFDKNKRIMNKKNDTYRQIGIGVPYNMND